MALARVHTTAADGTFSASGAAAWNASHGVTGATSGGIPYFDSTTSEASSALLAANSLVIGGGAGAAPFTSGSLTFATASGPRLLIGGTAADTNAGLLIGQVASAVGAIWNSTLTPSTTNFGFKQDNGGNSFLNAPTGSDILLTINGGEKMRVKGTAGQGITLDAGTATTDVNALSVTQTWNAAGVAFVHEKHVITDTASAAGSLAVQYLGGAAGATNLFKVSKAGLVDAPAYAVNGAAGASFGPGAVASITVVNGIITAIS